MNLISEIKTKKSLQIIYEDNKQINLDDLVEIIDQNSSVLNQLSIKKKDTVAIVLENGPEFITSFLSSINCCIAAPLYRRSRSLAYAKQ